MFSPFKPERCWEFMYLENEIERNRKAVKIFFCYAHEDEALLKKLKNHLRPLEREGLIQMWHDRDIHPGMEWEKEIDRQLTEAQVILLLISPDFMNSDYCYGIEMRRAIERHKRNEARVIPIILRPIYWQGAPFGKLQALPADAKPIVSSSWHDQDEALYDVTEGIHRVIEDLVPERSFAARSVPSKIRIVEAEEKNLNTFASGNKGSVDRKTFYQRFFAELLGRLRSARPDITQAKKAQPDNFYLIGAGKTGYCFNWTFKKNGLKVELLINIPDNLDATKRAFDALYEQRAIIEKELGQPLHWDRLEGKESHIFLLRPATINDSSEELEQLKQWAVETMIEFADVFKKRIRML